MTRTLKALIFANLLGLVAFAFVLSVAPPRVDRTTQPSAFPVAADAADGADTPVSRTSPAQRYTQPRG